MLPLTCPHCRGTFAFSTAQAGQAIQCPICRGVMIAVAPQPESFAALEDEPVIRRDRTRQLHHRTSNTTLLIAAVGLVVAIAAALFIYDRTSTYYDRTKLKELADRHHELTIKLLNMQKEIGYTSKQPGSPMDHHHFTPNDKYKQLLKEYYDVVEEHKAIRARHPEWNVKPLIYEFTD